MEWTAFGDSKYDPLSLEVLWKRLGSHLSGHIDHGLLDHIIQKYIRISGTGLKVIFVVYIKNVLAK